MKISNENKIVISGAPQIGEGNIIDNKSITAVLSRAGIQCMGFYPNGPFVRLGKWFHIKMTRSTKKTIRYARNSEASRSSLKVRLLQWELRREVRRALRDYPDSRCFITSQNIIAEESVGAAGDIPTVIMSSDVYGKLSPYSKISERHHKITYFVWSREAYDYYENELKLRNVHLVIPVDPMNAFNRIERGDLPFREALNESDLCFIKLSGSGGDTALINSAIISLWEKSRVKSIVFPGTEGTRRRIINSVDNDINVYSSLDAAVYYSHAREMMSGLQMLLAYPSEQVKHVAILAAHNVFPNVVWLPPRGQHEVMNLVWAMKRGFSGTVCMPVEYHSQLKSQLTELGANSSEFECVSPEKLSARHFKPTPKFKYETNSVPFEIIIKKITGA